MEADLCPGFIRIHASRNYGARDAVEKMVADFPGLIFVGSLYGEQDFGNDYIENNGDVDSCNRWRFPGSHGSSNGKRHRISWTPNLSQCGRSINAAAEAIRAYALTSSRVAVPSLLNIERSLNQFMTQKELENFYLIRRRAGLLIDPVTAEVKWWYTQMADPYDIDPDLPEEYQQVGRGYFARSPESKIWVWFPHLPEATKAALWEMHKRELAFPAGLPIRS